MSDSSVSVVIPAYRAAGVIGRALDSVFAQTRQAEQVVVVDDGSPDDLDAALRPYAGRVTLLRKANGGASSARNHGIEQSSGDVVAFLDADDYWEPRKLARQLEVMRLHPEVGLVGSRYFKRDPGGECEPSHGGAGAGAFDVVVPAAPADVLRTASLFSTPSVLVRRSALGGLRFDETLRASEDLDLWIRLVLRTASYVVSEPLTTVVFEPGSLSRADVDAGYSPRLAVARRYAGAVSRRDLARFEAGVFRGWASAHLCDGEPRRAVSPAYRRVRIQPGSVEAWWVLAKSCVLGCLARPVLSWPRAAGSNP
jgi:glycosyltransferase involved in cell wall biosynthesis